MCGKFDFWVYGCRGTAQAWERFYVEKLEEVAFVRGKGSGVVFYHESRDISALVHGDDFVFVTVYGIGFRSWWLDGLR